MSVQTRLRPLIAIYCPVEGCFLKCPWVHLDRSHNEEMAMCERHGFVAVLRSAHAVQLFDFAADLPSGARADFIDKPKLCWVCQKGTARPLCSYVMCSKCCVNLGNVCAFRPHNDDSVKRHGLNGVGTSSPIASLGDLHIGLNVKIEISVVFSWRESPVRKACQVKLYGNAIVKKAAHAVYMEDLSDGLLNKLCIADVPIRRIFDATDLEEGPAFNQQGYALYKKDARTGIRCLRLFVYGNLEELSKHYELLPEEADPTRDFDTLGFVLAHVRCNFLEDDTWTEVDMDLPRRRLNLEDCRFFVTDFTLKQRSQLKILGISDARISQGPNVPLDANPYKFGKEADEVEVRLYVSKEDISMYNDVEIA